MTEQPARFDPVSCRNNFSQYNYNDNGMQSLGEGLFGICFLKQMVKVDGRIYYRFYQFAGMRWSLLLGNKIPCYFRTPPPLVAGRKEIQFTTRGIEHLLYRLSSMIIDSITLVWTRCHILAPLVMGVRLISASRFFWTVRFKWSIQKAILCRISFGKQPHQCAYSVIAVFILISCVPAEFCCSHFSS